MRPRIADFYVPQIYAELCALGNQNGVASGGPGAVNRAYYVPIIFPWPCQLYSLTFIANNGTGNYDLGFYDGYSKTKIQSTGSTAMTAAGAKTMNFTSDYRVDAGKIYYAALSLSSTSGAIWRYSGGVVAQLIMCGLAQESSALPLNSTMTPATLADNFAPVFVFGVR